MGIGAETGGDFAKLTGKVVQAYCNYSRSSSKNEQKRRFYVSARWWRRFMKFGALCVGANQPRHFFTRDTEWMGFETTGLGFLSESYPCDPRLKSTFLICDFE
jgi:hypothetical protein